MIRILACMLLAGSLGMGVMGCTDHNSDMSGTNRDNPDTSTGNSQQATQPPASDMGGMNNNNMGSGNMPSTQPMQQ